jgi:hypothetical protein
MAAAIVGAIVAITLAILTLAFGPEVLPGVVAGIAAAVGGICAMALKMASTATGGGTSIKTQVLHLQEKLLANRELALASNDLIQIAYLQHWALLKALGAPIESQHLTWPVDLTNRTAAQGRRAYELTLWQTLSPTVWYVAGYRHRGGEKYAYHYTGHASCSAEDWLFVQKGQDYKSWMTPASRGCSKNRPMDPTAIRPVRSACRWKTSS